MSYIAHCLKDKYLKYLKRTEAVLSQWRCFYGNEKICKCCHKEHESLPAADNLTWGETTLHREETRRSQRQGPLESMRLKHSVMERNGKNNHSHPTNNILPAYERISFLSFCSYEVFVRVILVDSHFC